MRISFETWETVAIYTVQGIGLLLIVGGLLTFAADLEFLVRVVAVEAVVIGVIEICTGQIMKGMVE